MSTVQREVTIPNKYGLHARPAMQLVELANRYEGKIEVSNGTLTVDVKSIMSVMRLAATKGTKLTFIAYSDGADEALDALVELVADGFGEMDDG